MLAVAGSQGPRVADPVLLRFCSGRAWTAGYRCSSTVATAIPTLICAGPTRCCSPASCDWSSRRGVDVLLLHCYPFHRHAGYLAQVLPHVYFDVGLAVNHTGLGSAAVVAESLELAPFAKILFSSDAYGPAELHFLGAHLWRRGWPACSAAGWTKALRRPPTRRASQA